MFPIAARADTSPGSRLQHVIDLSEINEGAKLQMIKKILTVALKQLLLLLLLFSTFFFF